MPGRARFPDHVDEESKLPTDTGWDWHWAVHPCPLLGDSECFRFANSGFAYIRAYIIYIYIFIYVRGGTPNPMDSFLWVPRNAFLARPIGKGTGRA